jgi:hypothetical protein
MTGARAVAVARERRRKAAPAVAYALRYTSCIGKPDSNGQIIPPQVREYAARLVTWALRRAGAR